MVYTLGPAVVWQIVSTTNLRRVRHRGAIVDSVNQYVSIAISTGITLLVGQAIAVVLG